MTRPSKAKVWFKASRAFSFTAALAPMAAVALMPHQGALHRFRLALAVLGAVLVQLGINLWNDASDHERGIDVASTLGGSRVIQDGWLGAPTMRHAAQLAIAAGLCCGIPTLLAAPQQMAIVGALTAIGAIGYSSNLLAFKYIGLGDFTVFMLCGPLLAYGTAVAAFGAPPPATIAVGSIFGFAATAILHTNNMQDTETDAQFGAKTMAIRIGPKVSRWYLLALYAAAFASWLVAARPLQLSGIAVNVGALPILPAMRFALRIARTDNLEREPLMRMHAAQMHVLYGVAVSAALLLNRFL